MQSSLIGVQFLLLVFLFAATTIQFLDVIYQKSSIFTHLVTHIVDGTRVFWDKSEPNVISRSIQFRERLCLELLKWG
jgi:hypothetical protein